MLIMLLGKQFEINILTGETKIVQIDLIYDCGKTLNPALYLGQVCNTTIYSQDPLFLSQSQSLLEELFASN